MDISKILGDNAETARRLMNWTKHLLYKHKVDNFKGKGRLTGPRGVMANLNAGRSEQLEDKECHF